MTLYGLSLVVAAALVVGAWGILTASHLLHRRYRRVTVPTLRFWQAALKKQRQDTLGGRWRHPWIWLLLCILAGLLVLGMMQPALTGTRGAVPHVVILDARASMGLATDEGGDRLDQARSLARQYIRRVADLGGITLVTVSDTAAVLSRADDSLTEALYQLEQVEVSPATTVQGMQQALNLAATLVQVDPRTGVVVVTDHELAAETLPVSLRPRMQVLNIADPINNLALLPLEVTPFTEGRTHVDVWVAYWGREPGHGTLSLLVGEETREALPISIQPGHMQRHRFTVAAADLDRLSARLYDEEPFAVDNRAERVSRSRYRVFLPDNAPMALRAALSAHPGYQAVGQSEQADVCFGMAPASAGSREHPEAVHVTPALCPDPRQRRAWMTDLFLGPTLVPVEPNEGSVLLATGSGQALAVRREGTPSFITLSPSLFDSQATFWKQVQFLPIVDAMMQAPRVPSSALATVLYSNLTSDQEAAAAELNAGTSVSLYRWLLWLILIVLGGEMVLYTRGKIV